MKASHSQFPSESYQAKVLRRKSRNESSWAKTTKRKFPKRKFPSGYFKVNDLRRKLSSKRSQAKIPNRRIPNESPQTKAPKRTFSSKLSQAEDVKAKMPFNIVEALRPVPPIRRKRQKDENLIFVYHFGNTTEIIKISSEFSKNELPCT